MTTKVVKGSLWTLAGQVAPLAVSLVTVPFVIRMLGAEGYGVVVLVALIPGYLTFADLGMGFASTKFAAEAYSEGKPEKEAALVRSSTLIALLSSLPFALALFLFSSYWIKLLNVPVQLSAEASLAFKFAAVGLVANLLANVVNSPQIARLRMDLNMAITAGSRTLGTLAVPLVIYLGGGISGAVFALMAAGILSFVGNVFVSGRLNPAFFGLTIDCESLGPLLRFGGGLALSGIAAVLLVNLEKIVLTRQSSVQDLAYYSVAFTFANAATLYSQAMGLSLMPAFSQLLTPDRREQLLGLFNRGLRLNLFGILPAVAILCVIARPFFTAWAGQDFGRESTPPFYILLVGLFFNLNAFIPAGLVMAGGRTDIFAKLYWLELIPYVALTALLTRRFGAEGAAAAWSLRVIVDCAIFFALAKKVFRTKYDLSTYTASLLGLAVLLPPILVTAIYAETWLAMTLLPISLLMYGMFTWRKVVEPAEKAWLKSQANRLFGTFRARFGAV
jgi:O-antigen/teichoic acid export membrane protein